MNKKFRQRGRYVLTPSNDIVIKTYNLKKQIVHRIIDVLNNTYLMPIWCEIAKKQLSEETLKRIDSCVEEEIGDDMPSDANDAIWFEASLSISSEEMDIMNKIFEARINQIDWEKELKQHQKLAKNTF